MPEEERPFRYLQLNISSGAGESRIYQAVIVRGGFDTLDPTEMPSLKAIEDGLTTLRDWIKRTYPDRDDWKLCIETRMHFPRADELTNA
jgi:hypothetical protein